VGGYLGPPEKTFVWEDPDNLAPPDDADLVLVDPKDKKWYLSEVEAMDAKIPWDGPTVYEAQNGTGPRYTLDQARQEIFDNASENAF